jgi:hypothetical protein
MLLGRAALLRNSFLLQMRQKGDKFTSILLKKAK